jgi:GH24 family phage-related lysozyme (muramidase)
MTTKTLTYFGELVSTTCWCGIGMALPASLYRQANEQGHQVYCPLGHIWVVTETETDRLRKELRAEKDYATSLNRRLTDEQNRLRTTKGVVTKMRKRAIVGACQFCHRNFANVARHVATQHPNEQP